MDTVNANQMRKRSFVAGMDITDEYSQISIGFLDDNSVETISQDFEKSSYNIPTVLYKRKEVNQWYFGNEALQQSAEEGYFLDNLLELARKKDEILLGDTSFSTTALLTLFMKRALSLINTIVPLSAMVSLIITVDNLDDEMVGILNKCVSNLNIKGASADFQSHCESVFYYNIYQEPELWKKCVLVISEKNDVIYSRKLIFNKNTTPVVAYIDEGSDDFSGFHRTLEKENNENALHEYDMELASYCERVIDSSFVSAAYLIGDSFKGEWCRETSNFLCRKARVFQGNNMFSKGAVYSGKNRIAPNESSANIVFLGKEMIKSNVGMNAYRNGKESYLALVDAGVNWFNARKECDIILDSGNVLSFLITPLTSRAPEIVDITLNDLPKRPDRTTRVHLSFEMLSVSKMKIVVKDLGFGTIFKSSNIEWSEVIDL